LGEGVRLSYSLLGPRENLVESFFSRFKAENRDLLMESRTLLELKEGIRERVEYYNAKRLPSRYARA
ncbi:MAG: transposase, partial [Thermus sp.]